MDDDPLVQKVRQHLINDKYYLVELISEGGFGQVYLGRDAKTGHEVAIKIELDDDNSTEYELRQEYDSYQAFAGLAGFPQVEWCGTQDYVETLVMELLGPSLSDLFAYCDKRFSLKTTLMLADQLLERLETLYKKGYVHRDIKPSNLVLGTKLNGNTVYIIDFGLAAEVSSRPRVGNNEASKDEDVNCTEMTGTVKYASMAAHTPSRGMHPKDDLESLAYVLVYFMGKKLPWQYLKSNENEEAYWLKAETSPAEICHGLPRPFAKLLKHAKDLKPAEKPKYREMRAMFRELARESLIEYDNVFDWTEKFCYQKKLLD